MVPEEGQPGVFSVVVHLPPGYHQYKFIVDGEWRHDEAQPFMPDPLGNVNNWLFVRKPEGHVPVDNDRQEMSDKVPTPIGASDHPEFGRQGDAAVMASLASEQEKEPMFTRSKVKEFLSNHVASELVPESGKVVLLDIDLPLRQALHALHEQGVASAPVVDTLDGSVPGIISASDFITTLQVLRNIVSTSSNPMSEAEMDQHTIRGLREELVRQGTPPKELVSVRPEETLQRVVDTLLLNHCSMAPIIHLSQDNGYNKTHEVLHNATLGGILGCLLRHFRSSLALLPLLAQPLESVPLGTWSPESSVAMNNVARGDEGRDVRKIVPLVTVTPSTLLTYAFQMLLDGGFSCLPVVNEDGVLIDIYARSDITSLAKSNAYSRLQFEDVTVGQALTLAAQPHPPSLLSGSSVHQAWGGPSPSASQSSIQDSASSAIKQRVHACTTSDPLRSVIERLSVPGVRRLLVVNPETKVLQGIVSLSDVASYLFA
jgi:5'-AMP-activated protein kinase regulatory gamma subunit